MIIIIIEMSGHHAYINFCATQNDCSPTELPFFTSVRDYIANVQTVAGETDVVYDESVFQEWLKEVQFDELSKQ